MESDGGVLALTTHRVRLNRVAAGESQLISITLDAVTSCGLVTKSRPLLLVAAACFGLIGLYMLGQNAGGPGVIALVLAAGLAFYYYQSRSAVLQIDSAGASIVIGAQSMGRERLIEFVDAVEEAKVAFLRNGGVVFAKAG